MEMNRRETKKDLILRAAEKAFSTKGFTQTKISDISASAGISDASLYELFENKEALLFTLPEDKTHQQIAINERHLRGLIGAEVKLRKLIWNYLEFLENNKDYASIILFELRKNRRFYESKAYELFRQFSQNFMDIIKEGMEEGVFRATINPYLLRNLIFGTVDHVMITWFLYEKPKNLVSQVDPFFDLIMKAAGTLHEPRMPESKKEQILKAASIIFSKKGYDKTKISDIARFAGIADGTIYQYFVNKEDILFNLAQERTLEFLQITETHLNALNYPERRLSVLIKDYLDYLQFNQDYSSIIIFELRYNRDFYESKEYERWKQFSNLILDAIRSGQKEGCFRNEVDPILCAKMVFGLIDHTMITWLLFRRPPALIAQSNEILDLILSAIKNPNKQEITNRERKERLNEVR